MAGIGGQNKKKPVGNHFSLLHGTLLFLMCVETGVSEEPRLSWEVEQETLTTPNVVSSCPVSSRLVLSRFVSSVSSCLVSE